MAEKHHPRLGGYELLESIGVGGMAEVYRARQLKAFNREVAVKIIKRGFTEDGLFRQRFLREGQATARLTHPHILPLIELGQGGRDGELLFLVMPYVRGGTLRTLLDRTGGPLPLHQTGQLFGQLCDAVQYAHNQGLVHRDIKPSNILLQNEHYILLADFGIALDMEDIRLTSTGLGMGTAEYTAPEQAKGFADFRSDLYSLGIVLFEMLTGSVPFVGRTAFDILFQHATAPVPPIHRVNPSLPEPLAGMDRVIQRALAKDPARRFQSAAELNAGVQAVLAPGSRASVGVVVSPQATSLDTQSEAGTPNQGESEQWSPPAAFLPLPLAASYETGGAEDRFVEMEAEERNDPAGERPTLLANSVSWRNKSSSVGFGMRPPSNRFQRFLLMMMAVLLLILASGAVYLGVRFFGAPGTGSSSALATPSPAPTFTTAPSPTATIRPTRTPRPTTTATASPSATPLPAQLVVTPPALTFTTSVSACPTTRPQQTLTIQNTGSGTLKWQAAVQNPAYLSISPNSGTLGPSATSTITVSLICPSAPLTTTDSIAFTSNGGASTVVVTITVA